MLNEDPYMRYDFKAYRDIALPSLKEVKHEYSQNNKSKQVGLKYMTQQYKKKIDDDYDIFNHENYSFNANTDMDISLNYNSNTKIRKSDYILKEEEMPEMPVVMDFKDKEKPNVEAIRIDFNEDGSNEQK